MNRHLSLAAAPLLAFTISTAHAQTSAPNKSAEQLNQLEEVVVTAQKRAEDIQEVPLSIMSVSGDNLVDSGIRNAVDLGKLVPSLQINNGVFQSGVIIRIRGFGSAPNGGTDSDVAAYVDSAFIPRPGAIMGSFLDVKNVEVLSGPQGTLFGRNAAMGAISINSNEPSTAKRSFDATVEGGNYGTYSGTGVANIPLSDRFAVRLAVKGTHTDGFFKNLFDGKTYGASDTTVGRVSAKWNITDKLDWTVRVDGSSITGDGAYPSTVYTKTASAAQLAALTSFATRFGGTAPVYSDNPSFTVNTVIPNPYNRDHQTGVTSDLSWNFSSALALRLINSYRDWANDQVAGDTIGTSLDLLSVGTATRSKAQSHELQLISPKGAFLGSKLGFTSGLYYFKEAYSLATRFNVGKNFCTAVLTSVGRPTLVPGCQAGAQFGAGLVGFVQNGESTAGYFQADYAILPTLELDAGVRYTKDRKAAVYGSTGVNPLAIGQIVTTEGPYPLAFDDNNTSARGTLSWHVTDKVMVFGTYSTGYKSGGFNLGGSSFVQNAAARTFASEKVKDLELGIKSTLADGRVRVNATFFDTKLANFQDRSFNGTGFVVRNSGDVKSRGVDLDAQVRANSSWSFNLGATYLDSTYASNVNAPAYEGCAGPPGCATTQVLTGMPVPFSPKVHGNAGVQWRVGAFGGYETMLALSENYSASFLTSNTDNPQSEVPSFATTDARISFTSPTGKWQFDLFGQNIFDKHYYVTTVAQTLGAQAGVTNTVTGATVFRGFLADPVRFGLRVSTKF